jgi:hypothetical protein
MSGFFPEILDVDRPHSIRPIRLRHPIRIYEVVDTGISREGVDSSVQLWTELAFRHSRMLLLARHNTLERASLALNMASLALENQVDFGSS